MENIIFIIAKAFQLFLVLDPLGNTGIIASLISGFDQKMQRKILYREISVSLIIMMIVYWLGSYLLFYLNISHAAITITGGIIFILFAISLLFPGSNLMNIKNLDEEPYIVPIATPLVVGPSSMATLIIFSHEKDLWPNYLASILLAWVITGTIILMGPFLVAKLGNTCMKVVERFIGLICALVAVKMLLKGLKLFLLTI